MVQVSEDRELKRLNLRMGKELHQWYEDEAKRLGTSVSALMIVVLDQYRKKNAADAP